MGVIFMEVCHNERPNARRSQSHGGRAVSGSHDLTPYVIVGHDESWSVIEPDWSL